MQDGPSPNSEERRAARRRLTLHEPAAFSTATPSPDLSVPDSPAHPAYARPPRHARHQPDAGACPASARRPHETRPARISTPVAWRPAPRRIHRCRSNDGSRRPPPLDITSGTTPSRNAADVITIGRKRIAAASMTARISGAPRACRSRANSTIRIAFFAASPMMVMSPS